MRETTRSEQRQDVGRGCRRHQADHRFRERASEGVAEQWERCRSREAPDRLQGGGEAVMFRDHARSAAKRLRSADAC